MYAKTKERQIYTILLSFCAVYAYRPQQGNRYGDCLCDDCTADPVFTKERERRIPYISFFGSMAVFLVIDKILVKYFRHAIWETLQLMRPASRERNAETAEKGTGIKSYHSGWQSGRLYNSFSSTLGLVCGD